MTMLRAPLLTLFFAVLFGSIACSGGGGGGGGGGATTGSVAVLITDGPSENFSAIEVTVSRIELLGTNPVDLFVGNATFDLLALEDFSNVFAVAEDVPVASYSKVRLHIDDLVLVRETGVGVFEEIRPPLPANGKIDLNPRETFAVTPGDLLVLEIDIDANKSIHVVGNGNGGYRFRPIVFIRVVNDAEDMEKLARVHGVVDSFEGADSLILCSEEVHAMNPGAGTSSDGCLRVILFGDTSVFDENGDPGDLVGAAVGDPLTVVGTLRVMPGDIELDAIVIELGPQGTFPRIAGEAASLVGVLDRFDLDITPGQGFPDPTLLPVQLQNGTAIVTRRGFSLAPSAIQVGTPVLVDGVLRPDDVTPAEIASALVLVKPPALELMQASGTIDGLDALGGSFDLIGDADTDCVEVALDATILLVSDGGAIASATPAVLADLSDGLEADVFGEMEGGCIAADAVIAYAP